MPPEGALPEARIEGRPASRAEGVREAARLLGAARLAVISGRYGDYATVEAAAGLAARCRGVIDHEEAGPALAELEVMRQGGWLVTTPLEARAMADLLLVLGRTPAPLPPTPPPLAPERERRILRLEAGGDELLTALGLLRARLKGRPLSLPAPLAPLAEALAAAHYAVIAWRAGEVDALAIEMVQGLLEELNTGGRRAFGLPLAIGGGVEGALRALTALTGLPLRSRFLDRTTLRHDPWRYDAARLIAAAEADALLYLGPTPPPWAARVPFILIAPAAPPAPAPAPRVLLTPLAAAGGGAVRFEPGFGVPVFRPEGGEGIAPLLEEIDTELERRP